MQAGTPLEAQGETSSRTQRGSRWFTQSLLLLLALALLGLLVYGIATKAEKPLGKGLAPDFTLPLFDGGQITLSELCGNVVVINVWASWCLTCRDEARALERTWRAYRDRGVVFAGVDYMDTEPAALAYIAEFDITYPNGPDLGGRIARAYNVQGVPETFFVDAQGEIAQAFIGPLNETELRSILERLLAETEGE